MIRCIFEATERPLSSRISSRDSNLADGAAHKGNRETMTLGDAHNHGLGIVPFDRLEIFHA